MFSTPPNKDSVELKVKKLDGAFKKSRKIPVSLSVSLAAAALLGIGSMGFFQIMLANYEHDSENSEQAIEYCNMAITMNPKLADAYELRALCYTSLPQPNYAAARKDIEEAIKLNPANTVQYLEQREEFELSVSPMSPIE